MQNFDKSKKSGLGRGLGSLLGGDLDDIKIEPTLRNDTVSKKPESQASTPELKQALADRIPVEKVPPESRIWNIAIEKIAPNPKQPRRQFTKELLEELAKSIKVHGILQPITVKKEGESFQIIAGERRWRAAQIAGLTEVPAIIKNFDEKKSLEMALIENIQRADLNPIEEAQAYELLLDRYALTQQEVADRVGKERATVANICRLLTLNKDVQEMVKEGQVSLGHAKALLSVADSKTQRKLALKVAKQKVSVRQLERLIKRGEEDVADASSPAGIDVSKKLVQSISEELQKRLGTKVEIDYHNQKGKISVHFYSDEELTSITDRMKAAWNR